MTKRALGAYLSQRLAALILTSLVVIVFLTVTALVQSQTVRKKASEMLLPEAVTISGVVLNSAGEAVAKASIEDTTSRGYNTDDQGKFSLGTRAPVLVFMKPGYASVRIATRAASNLKVTLLPITDPAPSLCPDEAVCDSLPGGRFCFPKSPDVGATKPGTDVDYVARGFVIQTKDGPRGIRHGSGPMWSLGRPFSDYVWESTDYREVVFDHPLSMLTDARGKTPDGKLWRYVGTFGESADYSGVAPDDAARLDRVLDGMCLLSSEIPPASVPVDRNLQNYLQNFAAKGKTISYSSALFDLNGDGKKEVIVYLNSRDWCRRGNCTTLVLEPHESWFNLISEIQPSRPPIVALVRSTHGWRHLTVRVAEVGISDAYEAELPFDGTKYAENPTVLPALRMSNKPEGDVLISK